MNPRANLDSSPTEAAALAISAAAAVRLRIIQEESQETPSKDLIFRLRINVGGLPTSEFGRASFAGLWAFVGRVRVVRLQRYAKLRKIRTFRTQKKV